MDKLKDILKNISERAGRKLVYSNINIYESAKAKRPVWSGRLNEDDAEAILEWAHGKISRFPGNLKPYNGCVFEFCNPDIIYHAILEDKDADFEVFVGKVEDILGSRLSHEPTFKNFVSLLDNIDSESYNRLVQAAAEYGKDVDVDTPEEANTLFTRDPLLERIWAAYLQIYKD